MAEHDLQERLAQLESQVAAIQSALRGNGARGQKNWRRAVEKYAGDPDLLAVFGEAKKLRDSERKQVRRSSSRRSKP
jgi:hypothetical protein